MKENIFIAGACGQIGKKLSLELIKYNNLILFDKDSNKLSKLDIKCKNKFIPTIDIKE